MTDNKLKRATGLEDMDFLEALERLSGVDPKEIRKEKERVKKRSDEVKRRVKETEESIDRGARRSKHRFSL